MAETKTDITNTIAPNFGTTPRSYMVTDQDYMNVYASLEIGFVVASGPAPIDYELVLYRGGTLVARTGRIRRTHNWSQVITYNHQFTNIAKKNADMRVYLWWYYDGNSRFSAVSPWFKR